jgi:hypothetical protein
MRHADEFRLLLGVKSEGVHQCKSYFQGSSTLSGEQSKYGSVIDQGELRPPTNPRVVCQPRAALSDDFQFLEYCFYKSLNIVIIAGATDDFHATTP